MQRTGRYLVCVGFKVLTPYSMSAIVMAVILPLSSVTVALPTSICEEVEEGLRALNEYVMFRPSAVEKSRVAETEALGMWIE